jgi:hypothetical protein
MASFCSQCCSNYGMEADIDLFKIALSLENGRSVSFICEGCPNRALYKDDTGLIYLAQEDSFTRKVELTLVRAHELLQS